MIPQVHFAAFRLFVIGGAALAQVYLYFRIRQALRSCCRSTLFRSWVGGAAALAIVLFFAVNGYLLSRPAPWVDPPAAAEAILIYPAAVWSFGSIFSALVLGLGQLLGGLVHLARRGGRGLLGRSPAVPVNLDRRRFVQTGMAGLAAAPLLLSGYGAFAAKDYKVHQLSLPFGRPLRLVQLTDIHAGPYMTREEMRRYADQVSALQPDLFVLTGDYISNSIKYLPECVEEMARVQARYGTFAVMGNHDRWFGEQREVLAVFRRHGITFLLNSHRVIPTENGPFAVAGIDDLLSGRPDLNAALSGLDPTIPTILLSHRPEIFPQAAGRDIPLTLAGHYHGGQIKLSLPGFDFSLANLRTSYPEGLYRLKDRHLYVSRGIGTTFVPIRLNARPEVTLVHLT